MSAYVSCETQTLVIAVLLLAMTLVAGFGITRIRDVGLARLLAWGLVIIAVIAAERLTTGEPPGFRMLVLIGCLLFAMKAVVCVEDGGRRQRPLAAAAWFAFAAGWFGMRPSLFENVPGRKRSGGRRLIRKGVVRMIAGMALVGLTLIVAGFVPWAAIPDRYRFAAAVPLLVGLSLIVHFGLFNVLAGVWRSAGADCDCLFRAPLCSSSLSEFWSRRWNLAFSEMTAITLVRPLKNLVGRPAGIVAAFLFSGLLHELAISLPVRTGFGGPMLYFCLHGLLVCLEWMLRNRGWHLDRVRWFGRSWTAFWVLLPLPILFHAAFLNEIVLPLVGWGDLPTCS